MKNFTEEILSLNDVFIPNSELSIERNATKLTKLSTFICPYLSRIEVKVSIMMKYLQQH